MMLPNEPARDLPKVLKIHSVIAGTQPLETYGGVRLSEEAIRSLVSRMLEGSVEYGVHHDSRRSIGLRLVSAKAERDERGFLNAVADFEIDHVEWESSGGSALTGFSVTARSPVFRQGPEATIDLAADAHWFSEEDLKVAAEFLTKVDRAVWADGLYQFSQVPDAWVHLSFIVNGLSILGTGVITNAIYDALKTLVQGFLKKRALHTGEGTRSAILHLTFVDTSTNQTREAYLETASEETIRHAIDTLPAALALNSRPIEYGDSSSGWSETPPR